MNIDERIRGQIQKDGYAHLTTEGCKELITEVLEYVKPGRMSEDEINIANTVINHPPKDMQEGHTHKDSLNMSKGFNFAIDEMETKIKELGL